MICYDAIILGTGGVGSAAAWRLARRGARVLGIDRFEGGHNRGSSHGETRIIRQAYFEHADYVPLLLRAYELWAELEAASGVPLLKQVGLLQVGPPDGEVVPGVVRSAKLHELEVEEFSAAEAGRRFPGFQVPRNMAAVFERKAGYLYVERCVLAHLAAAKECGAELLFATSVIGWEADDRGVRVTTDRGVFHADKLVLAGGPWMPGLLGKGERSPRLQVLRKHVYWFENDAAELHQDRGCPTYLFELPHGVFYGFPQIDGLGVKAAEHTGGVAVDDPLQDDRALDPADLARVRQFMADHLPGVSDALTRHSVCYYTMSPDGHFIVDRHPEHERVVYAAGLSGHGFKFTSVLGEALADLALEGRTNLPIEFLSGSRFRGASEAVN